VPAMPVVVLSAIDDEEIAVQAMHHGVQDYLVKGTFDGKQLSRTLRYAIERQAGAVLKAVRDRAIAKGRYYTKAAIGGDTTFTCSFCEYSVNTLRFDKGSGNRRTQAVAAINQHVSSSHHDLWKERHATVSCGRAGRSDEETQA